MTDQPLTTLRIADLPRNGRDVTLTLDAAACKAIAAALGIVAVKKLRFSARLTPLGQRDWALDADLGATVVQDCVVTLDPVTTRIDETVRRTYLSEMPEPEATEVEMPEDDSAEPLPQTLDLMALVTEALALALPPFPRSAGADLGEAVFTEPGKAAMRDQEARPFAGLAGLRKSLENKDDKCDD